MSNVVRFERPTYSDLRDQFRRSLDLTDVGERIGQASATLARCSATLTFAHWNGLGCISESVAEAIAEALKAADDVKLAIAERHRREDDERA